LAAELRWILLGLSVLLLAGIWWWGGRRSRQARGDAELRQSMGLSPPGYTAVPADEPPALGEPPWHETTPRERGRNEPAPEHRDADSREWGVPPFEPLSIRTADFEPAQIIDLPMMSDGDGRDVTLNPDNVEPRMTANMPEPASSVRPGVAIAGPRPAAPTSGPRSGTPVSEAGPAPASRAPDNGGHFTAATPQAPNVSETQRIVTLRVCAQGESHWTGGEVMAALENHGLGYGRYKVFHRKHSDGRTLFCAASLLEPGTFDLARMPEEEFRGLTLFAVLPGPAEPLQTIDALVATAAELADTLHGTVQDSQGLPLSAQRAEALREDVARFQALLSMT
jgi:cell division protein ZipA